MIALGRQTAVADPNGKTTRYGYDAHGVVTKYGYDSSGRLMDVIENYVAGAAADAQTNVHTTYACDPGGNRRAISMAVRNDKVAQRYTALEWRLGDVPYLV